MSEILILMHNPVNVKIGKKVVELFLKEYSFDSTIIAPPDFVIPGVDPHQMPEKIMELIPTNNEIRIIFFEANLGYPGQENLREPTVEVLKFLIKNCPEATFILKSQTEAAIKNAQIILQEEQIASEQIFPDGWMLKINDDIKQAMRNALEEQNLKIKFH
ncbi:hypothetical protein [Legionella maioricensis]|uniref:Uncharacterized protein n=1 Tax=Legionella maioricensis TaxID=2896528 RepID=A0A9X2D1E7_9GAMM|nr:hypothetical protein [Legionella maioricensis]MCL9684744.1 hypothetical protein [Legionella maioricensis]MCL9687772.1 hypothetical protein [Legionella maioricensis]